MARRRNKHYLLDPKAERSDSRHLITRQTTEFHDLKVFLWTYTFQDDISLNLSPQRSTLGGRYNKPLAPQPAIECTAHVRTQSEDIGSVSNVFERTNHAIIIERFFCSHDNCFILTLTVISARRVTLTTMDTSSAALETWRDSSKSTCRLLLDDP